MRTDGVHCRESAGSGPEALKAVPVTGAAFSGITMDQFLCASLFPHPLLVVGMFKVSEHVSVVWSSLMAEYRSAG